MGYRWGPLDLVAHRLSWRRCAGGKPSQGCKTERVYCVELVCTSVWVDLCVRLDVVGVCSLGYLLKVKSSPIRLYFLCFARSDLKEIGNRTRTKGAAGGAAGCERMEAEFFRPSDSLHAPHRSIILWRSGRLRWAMGSRPPWVKKWGQHLMLPYMPRRPCRRRLGTDG